MRWSERRWFRRNEVHAKIAQGLESLRQGKGLDGESIMAELQGRSPRDPGLSGQPRRTAAKPAASRVLFEDAARLGKY